MNSYAEYKGGAIALAKLCKRKQGNQGNKDRTKIKDVVCAFDIETTRFGEIAIMYIWQFAIDDICYYGRTWEEYKEFIAILEDELEEDEKVVVWVHNLSYEFQFLRSYFDFNGGVFATKARKVLKATSGKIEYRCSYIHSNMSLAVFLEKLQVENKKLSYDYDKKRYPWTPLTPEELAYCENDVVGLCQAIRKEMDIDGDTLYTIPLTSTGYVRREVKKEMRGCRWAGRIHGTFETYELLRKAFSGGNTHANRYYAGRILENVKSADRASSYPAEQICKEFPVSEFSLNVLPRLNDFVKALNRGRAIVTTLIFSNIRLKNRYWGCPYISRHKCVIINGLYDNGRVLSAEKLQITVTDIDYMIIDAEYIYDKLECIELATATYGKLPEEFVSTAKRLYKDKTELKDVPGQEVFYMKQKNKLNSVYGMSAQDPGKVRDEYVNGAWVHPTTTPMEAWEEAVRKAPYPYAWGVWTTAHARNELEKGIIIAGEGFVYCDTDSVKYIDDCNFEEYNYNQRQLALKNGGVAYDKKSIPHYMGEYESEREYRYFATLGAKKYAFDYGDGNIKVTISGVDKRKGGKELQDNGGLERFCEAIDNPFTFFDAGGLEAVYDDDTEERKIIVEERELWHRSGVLLKPSTYTLGITDEYKNIIGV